VGLGLRQRTKDVLETTMLHVHQRYALNDGNLLDFGQTGVIAVNHVMEDLDGEHEKGAVPSQVQSMAGKNVVVAGLKKRTIHVGLGLRQRTKDVLETTMLHVHQRYALNRIN
jgi:hypothetical protein